MVAPLDQYVQVYLNGQFYGLYGMIEKVRAGLVPWCDCALLVTAGLRSAQCAILCLMTALPSTDRQCGTTLP